MGNAERKARAMVRKLEGLRGSRLRLAELQLARTRAAHEEAVQAQADAEVALTETIAASHVQYRQLDEQLQARTALKREHLYDWGVERKNVGAGVDAAHDRVDQAQRERLQQEEALEAARRKQRSATADVERTRMMLEKMRT
jgi:hypothetical protein